MSKTHVDKSRWLSAEDRDGYYSERATVDCDDHCGAVETPETQAELLAAYEHWKYHGVDLGCSHGR